jgi:hypothetical protein
MLLPMFVRKVLVAAALAVCALAAVGCRASPKERISGDQVRRLAESLNDPQNPLGYPFTSGREKPTWETHDARAAFVRRYGFTDEYQYVRIYSIAVMWARGVEHYKYIHVRGASNYEIDQEAVRKHASQILAGVREQRRRRE